MKLERAHNRACGGQTQLSEDTVRADVQPLDAAIAAAVLDAARTECRITFFSGDFLAAAQLLHAKRGPLVDLEARHISLHVDAIW